jgi:hypothetical protein
VKLLRWSGIARAGCGIPTQYRSKVGLVWFVEGECGVWGPLSMVRKVTERDQKRRDGEQNDE